MGSDKLNSVCAEQPDPPLLACGVPLCVVFLVSVKVLVPVVINIPTICTEGPLAKGEEKFQNLLDMISPHTGVSLSLGW